jgi:hypothetical protein
MVHLGALRQGRKTVLYMGREFGLGRDSSARTTELVRAANDANVAFYSINPDGIDMRGIRYGMLTDLAANTGGEAMVTNAPALALRRAVHQSAAVYLLGYAPEPLRQDGKFHKIDVRVRRPRLQVRARNGYWAPAPETRAAARERAEAASVSAPVESAIGELARLARTPDPDALALKTVVEPDPPVASLAVTAPALWRIRKPADLRDVLGDVPPPAHDGRRFARVERLIVRFDVHGELRGQATVSAGLLDKRGGRLTALPLTHDERGYTMDLPLASIARGDYVLAVEARAGEIRAAAYVPLQVH